MERQPPTIITSTTPWAKGMAIDKFSRTDADYASRQERLQQELLEKTFSDCKHGRVIRLDDIVQSHPMSNDDHIIYEIHDILKSYYKLARKRFVDNMRKQVADHFLLIGPNTPLKLFSSRFVASLSPPKLEEVAGEEFGTRRQRAELEKDIGLLEKGMAILR